MPLDFRSVRQRSIEAILKQAVDLHERFQNSPLHYQRMYLAEYEAELQDWLERLGPVGIYATSLDDALMKYEELSASWTTEVLCRRSKMKAKLNSLLVEEERAELAAYLAKNGLTKSEESDQSLQQKAAILRIRNRWTHLRERGFHEER